MGRQSTATRWMLLSGGVHLALLLLGPALVPAPPAVPGPDRTDEVDLEVVEQVARDASVRPLIGPQEPELDTAEAVEPTPAAQPVRPPRTRPRRTRPRPAGRVERSAPTPPQAEKPRAPGIDLSMRPGGDRPDLSLDPSHVWKPGPPQPGTRRPGAASEESVLARNRRLKAQLDGSLAAERARRNVTEGRAHPVLYDVERDAKRLFHPTWELSEQDATGVGTMGDTAKRLARALGKAYLERLEDYMEGPEPEGLAKNKRQRLLEGYEALMRVTDKSAAGFSCDVCVEVVPGRPAATDVPVRLARSSRRPAFDRLALDALKKAVRSRAVPTDAARVDACYRFTAKFYRVPPLPMVGCQFDEVKLNLHCYYPGKKILKADVSLLTMKKHPTQ